MTHKWLSNDYDQALEQCVADLMDGKKLNGLTGPEIIGDYEWPEIMGLYMAGNHDMAKREAERCLEHFLMGKGNYIVTGVVQDIQESREVEALERRRSVAGVTA